MCANLEKTKLSYHSITGKMRSTAETHHSTGTKQWTPQCQIRLPYTNVVLDLFLEAEEDRGGLEYESHIGQVDPPASYKLPWDMEGGEDNVVPTDEDKSMQDDNESKQGIGRHPQLVRKMAMTMKQRAIHNGASNAKMLKMMPRYLPQPTNATWLSLHHAFPYCQQEKGSNIKWLIILRKGLQSILQSSLNNVTHINSSNNHVRTHPNHSNTTTSKHTYLWHHHSTGDQFDQHNKQQQSIRVIYQNIAGLS